MSKRLSRIRDQNARRRIRRERRGARLRAFLWRWLRRGLVLTGLTAAAGGVIGWLGYQQYVVADPGEHISEANILDIIAQESPVLYRDGETRIGVFFAREHRDYVQFERIPEAWVQAITSSEDQRFFDHAGVDPKGIARAMVSNLKARRVVAGGSTLTQQTAKNLYYRPDRSIRSKLVELVNALRLEAHHDKEAILEFYANQFHVSANGRGLGIAARYFFDKDVEDLTTLECAYIAGMVKAPAAYNPFIGKTQDRRDEARKRAKARTRYVLDRMRVLGHLSETEHARLIEQDIPFSRGTFRYDSSVLLDEVAARLEQGPYPQLFAELGIDNPSTAGIQVVTTLDADAQREATWALWHHLSEVGPLLEGQKLSAFTLPAEQAPQGPRAEPVSVHGFGAAKVIKRGEGPSLTLDLGGQPCIVDADGLTRVATILRRAELENPYVQAAAGGASAVADGLPVGTVVRASLRSPGKCDLELRPDLQGAVLLLRGGEIQAMVGGNDNRNFNRATAARRQLGSTWKPLVYAAAMQLGWAPTDLLDNRQRVFTFEGTWYYPRADHASTDFVTLHQAGTASENLASIWLLYHLLDRLGPKDFREAASRAGLVPLDDEPREDWIRRVRDDYGVISTPARMAELAFMAGRQEVIADLDLSEEEAASVWSLYYGRGAEAERARVASSGSAKTRVRKIAAVDNNYLRLNSLREQCALQASALATFARSGREAAGAGEGLFGWLTPKSAPPEVPAMDGFSLLRVRPSGTGLLLGCATEAREGAPWVTVGEALLTQMAAGEGPPLPDAPEVWLPGGVRASTLEAIGRAAKRRKLVLDAADAWSFETLQHHPDFRALVAMRYVAAYARELGVETDLPPVLSMPLGAIDVSLVEATSMYAGMTTGEVTSFAGERPGLGGLMQAAPATDARALLIAEIRDRNGAVLYRAKPRARRVSRPETGVLVADILRSVVAYGTGRRARGKALLQGVEVPLAGKTGTTNGFRNAAFLGAVPRATAGGWDYADGYALGVYVGYDDNRPMVKGRTRLAGASGALPAWYRTAAGLAEAGLLGAEAPPSEAERGEGLALVPLDPDTGAVLPGGEERFALVLGEGLDEDGVVEVERVTEPFTLTPGAAAGGGLPPAPAPAPSGAPASADPTAPPAASGDDRSPAEPGSMAAPDPDEAAGGTGAEALDGGPSDLTGDDLDALGIEEGSGAPAPALDPSAPAAPLDPATDGPAPLPEGAPVDVAPAPDAAAPSDADLVPRIAPQ